MGVLKIGKLWVSLKLPIPLDPKDTTGEERE